MDIDEFIGYLRAINEQKGRLATINTLVTTCSLNLPDAVLIYDTFVKL